MIAPTTLVSVPAKSVHAERINPFPTRVQTRFCTNIEQSPGARNNIVSTIVPNRATRDNRIGRCVKSPLKNDAAVADEFVEFIGYINLRIEAAAGSYKLDNVLALLDKPLEAPVPGAVPPEAARYLGKGVHDQDEHLVSAELADTPAILSPRYCSTSAAASRCACVPPARATPTSVHIT